MLFALPGPTRDLSFNLWEEKHVMVDVAGMQSKHIPEIIDIEVSIPMENSLL